MNDKYIVEIPYEILDTFLAINIVKITFIIFEKRVKRIIIKSLNVFDIIKEETVELISIEVGSYKGNKFVFCLGILYFKSFSLGIENLLLILELELLLLFIIKL